MRSLILDSLTFTYPRGAALFDDAGFKFTSGRTALLGPNGAGKTTLISLMATVLVPQAGSVILKDCRREIRSDRVRRYREQIAWLPQNFAPASGLSVEEHVTYAAWLRGVSRKEAKACTGEALAQVGLQDMAKRRATTLSGGQQRRLGLAGALAHDASVILLDEPTAGLDPNQREKFREILQGLDSDKVVLVSTHQTEDIDGTFDSVFVLDQGQQKFHGTTDEFMALGGDRANDPRDMIRRAYGQLVIGEA
ncbi:ATP-binding cassette domain-containing protein [Glutamicibacter sp. NPDC087344]|uniref:ATP-binding cassette domain-containing protein n=1 Tax=Glutamicibacter sp. NPDC087344 TaxID=3363994 RepID=UPI00382BFF5E